MNFVANAMTVYRHSVQHVGIVHMTPTTFSSSTRVGQSTVNSFSFCARRSQTSSGALPSKKLPSSVNVTVAKISFGEES
jgi:hypothetical protein